MHIEPFSITVDQTTLDDLRARMAAVLPIAARRPDRGRPPRVGDRSNRPLRPEIQLASVGKAASRRKRRRLWWPHVKDRSADILGDHASPLDR
jgi:hypothetical protein